VISPPVLSVGYEKKLKRVRCSLDFSFEDVYIGQPFFAGREVA
jgi:hypothetical protein